MASIGAGTDAAISGVVDDHVLPSTRSAYYSLFVLTIVVMFTVLDRQILSLMIEPAKEQFGINDTQAALLLGAAFALPYAVAGIPIARYADRGNRRNLVAMSIAFWSIATCCCGIAQNYWQMIMARLGIGAGESGYGPATWSIVTDSFPREKVAFGTGTLLIGATAGSGLALFLGGAVLTFVEHLPRVGLPGGGYIHPWQWAFILVGAPGLIWALIVLTIREPNRRGAIKGEVAVVPVRQVIGFMGENWRVYVGIIGGLAMKMLMGIGSSQWMPTLYLREFGWKLADVGLIIGSMTLVISPIALIAGGKVSEYWMKRGTADANMRILLYGLLVGVPIAVITPLMPSPWLVLGLSAVSMFISSLGSGPGIASLQIITPNRMRAQVSSVYQFSTHVISLAVGPLIVALFTDYLFGDSQHLKYSLALSAALLGPLTIILVWQGMKPYTRAYERAVAEGY